LLLGSLYGLSIGTEIEYIEVERRNSCYFVLYHRIQ